MTEYFYAPPANISRGTITINGDEFNHLVHVMRRQEGDAIRVVDGEGTAYDVVITGIGKRMVSGRIEAVLRDWNEPTLNVTLGAGVLKNPSKFDFLVEKVTELGVKRIIPMTTKRTIPRRANAERWRKLALAATKQCGRSYIPRVDDLHTLPQVLDTVQSYGLCVICHESAPVTHTLEEVMRQSPTFRGKSVLILLGPEGGFDEDEYAAGLNAGCHSVALGSRRLRTETAAITVAALVLQRQ